MADIPNRDELEAEYARLLARLLSAYGGRLLEKLGDPPSFENIPAEFWDEEAAELRDKLRPFGNRVFTDAAQRLMDDMGVGVDWSIVNDTAAEWASRYTFDLVRGITSTNREKLQSAVTRYYRDSQTMGELVANIRQQYGPVRAELIAVTEVTRAATEGERELAAQLRGQTGIAITLRPVWHTNNDELVCPICGPKHGREIIDGQYPPAHPRCRCWVSHEAVMPEAGA